MNYLEDLECDLMSYCLKHKGRWWANHLLWNREVAELYGKIRVLDLGTVIAILGCGCADYEKHVRTYRDFVEPILRRSGRA